MLERRFVESYVPKSHLQRWARAHDKEETFAAFEALDEDHQDHFNMKRGLGSDRGREDFSGRNAEFWSGQRNTSGLDNGFGRDLATVFEDPGLSHFDYDERARSEANEALGCLLRML